MNARIGRLLLVIVTVLLLVFSLALSAENWSKQFEQTVKRHLISIDIVSTYMSPAGILVPEHGSCSGVVVGRQKVLSAAHCFLPVSDDRKGYVRGKEVWILKASPEADLVLLEADTGDKTPITIPPTGPKSGSPVAAIGWAQGDDTPSISPQSVLGYSKDVVYANNMIFHGYSGGPLIDSKGRLAGIMVQTNMDWNFSVSVNIAAVRAFLGENY